MNYQRLSKEALIRRIEQLERLNLELFRENDSTLTFAWSGNLGQWYLDFITGEVSYNRLKVEILGYSQDDIPNPVPYSFFTSLIHPDDYLPVMKNMKDHMDNLTNVYEVEYRIKAKDGSYKWFYDRGKVTQRDKNNQAVLAAGIVFDITQKKLNEMRLIEEKNKLITESLTDPLTGILNRRAILEELSQRMNHHLYDFEHLSILMLDIDLFKKINDNYGHIVGDKVLIKVSEIISQLIREFDTVGRYGGEEFLVILPNTNSENAYKAAERIRKKIEETEFDDIEHLTVSIGFTSYADESIESLINKADQNLYEAKKTGRNNSPLPAGS